MNYIDLILLAVLLLALISGIAKGFIHQLTSFAALVAGLLAAIWFSHYVAGFIGRFVDLGAGKHIVAFVLTFVVVLLVIRICGNWIKRLAEVLMLGFLDKLLGGLFSLLKWSFILSLLLLLFTSFNNQLTLIQPRVLSQSKLYGPIQNIVPRAFPNFYAWYGRYIKPATKGA